MAVGGEEAVEAVRAVAGPAPTGGAYAAQRDDDSAVWTVTLRDAPERAVPCAWPGGMWLVAPDLSVFPVSGDPVLHDGALARALLGQLHREGLTRHVDPAAFVARLERLTRERAELAAAVLVEARAGQLRGPRRRSLP